MDTDFIDDIADVQGLVRIALARLDELLTNADTDQQRVISMTLDYLGHCNRALDLITTEDDDVSP